METTEKIVLGVIGLIVLGVLGLVFFSIVGVHINTGNGNHVGYVTAVEKGGVLFKTGTAYFKTDNQSSQEDKYCVMDDSVLTQLKDAAEKKEKVELTYFSYLFSGVTSCNGEDAIISGVKILQ